MFYPLHLDLDLQVFFFLGGNTPADLKLYALGCGGSGPGSGVGSFFCTGLEPDLKLYGLSCGPNGHCGEGGGKGTFALPYLAFLICKQAQVD